MKKLLALAFILMLALTALAACVGDGEKNNPSGDTGNTGENPSEGNNAQNGSITLAKMKQAAKDAGYTVEDEALIEMWGAEAGFSVHYGNSVIPVLEYKDKADADAIAQQETNAGYNYPVQNGKYLTFASAENGAVKDAGEKEFLENLIKGNPIAPAE